MKHVKNAVAILTVLVMLVSLSAGLVGCSDAAKTSVVLEVGTVTQLYINSKEVVTDSDAALNGSKLDKAISTVIDNMIQSGELTAEENTVLITVSDAELQQTALSYASQAFEALDFTGAAICQNAEEGAQGKALLIQRMVDAYEQYSEDILTPLTVNQLKLLCEADESAVQGVSFAGTASQAAYIGADTALEIALAVLDADAEAIKDSKVILDYSSELMFYDVTFTLDGTALESYISADTGELLYSGIVGGERLDDDMNTEITEETAIAAACLSVGADVAAVKDVTCTFVDFTAEVYYDITFTYQGSKHSVLISAATGMPLESDVVPEDTFDDTTMSEEDETVSPTQQEDLIPDADIEEPINEDLGG